MSWGTEVDKARTHGPLGWATPADPWCSALCEGVPPASPALPRSSAPVATWQSRRPSVSRRVLGSPHPAKSRVHGRCLGRGGAVPSSGFTPGRVPAGRGREGAWLAVAPGSVALGCVPGLLLCPLCFLAALMYPLSCPEALPRGRSCLRQPACTAPSGTLGLGASPPLACPCRVGRFVPAVRQ